MKHAYVLPFALFFALADAPCPAQTEQLRIVYELSLNRCREHSCHVEAATRSEVQCRSLWKKKTQPFCLATFL